ncbi:TPA: hypothetical protein IYB51_002022 [Enterococcus faecium]|uniref:hypothetical protein n=1 Tax=Enterococcus faecium TaxID=1352 RepID=UPI000D1D2293|nr:hypothetical protein [Enterococcus faecium]MCZ2005921.1 hypothetical protein [Enterococcus faecium]HAP6169405.1 hypothetical protein [Enterococcus faecium]HAP8044891.1 hypothetical protein [Enterococcus faecium]HAP8071878.1 hypothetical protein [Enterococcus faecium]HAQ8185477.1 hypothetical protein [Enterococcus faecium]
MLLKRYIESFTYYHPELSRKERIEVGRKQLFDFDYPFYDETKRAEFETKFINHFYLREIGSETMGSFKFNLDEYLNLNMPYWNKMFLSNLEEFPIFDDMDYTIDEKQKLLNEIDTNIKANRDESKNQTKQVDQTDNRNKNTRDTGTTDSFSRNTYTDTPQKDLKIASNGDGTGVINYATNITEDLSKETTSSTGVETNNDKTNQNTRSNASEKETKNTDINKDQNQTKDTITRYKGKKGSTDYADLLEKYRKSVLRIEKMIFREMNKEGLFLLVYGGR